MTLQSNINNRLVLMMMTTLVLTIGIIMFVFPLAGAEDDAVARGYVYDRGSGTELEGVGVNLWGDPHGNYTETDAMGFFEMGVPGGGYHVDASKDGYKALSDDIVLENGTVFWYNFTLAAENAVIRGYAFEEHSWTPIEDAYINIRDGDEYGNGTATDASGYYEMNAAAGYWMFWANADGYSSSNDQFDLSEHEEKWINITLKPPSSMIQGYIMDEDTGRPIEGVRVTAYGEEGGNESMTDADGYFEFRIFEGPFQFMTEMMGYYGYSEHIYVRFEMTVWMSIHLKEAAPETSLIRGYIMKNDMQEPIEGAFVHADISAYYWYNETDGAGYFEIRVPEGWFDFNVYKEGFIHYSEHIYVGEYATVWMNITLELLPPQTSIIRGYISGDDSRGPIEWALVGIWGGYMGNQTWTDQDGYFEMWTYPGEFLFWTMANGYADRNEWITIGDYEEIWRNVTLLKENAMIRGYIRDDSQVPVQNAQVLLENHVLEVRYEDIWTDVNGYFERSVVAGEYQVEVNAWEYFGYRETIQIDVGEEFWFNRTIEHADIVWVEGFVSEGETGNPVVHERIDFNSERYGDGTWTDDQGYFMVWLASGLWYDIELDMPGMTDPEEIFVDGNTQLNITYFLPNILPVVDAGDNQQVIVDDRVDFLANATDPDGTIVSYEWDFDTDGIFTADHISTTADADHTYTTPGSYTVTVRVTDDRGGVKEDTLIVVVKPAVIPSVPMANLQIDSLSLSKLDPKDGDKVTISVILKNSGDANATDIKVRIFVDNKLKDLLDVDDIPANSTVTVTYDWIAIDGKHSIRINMTYTDGGDETTHAITVEGEGDTFISRFGALIAVVSVLTGAVIIAVKRKW